MKILHTIDTYYPNQSSLSQSVKRISQLLVRLGHSVTVATKNVLHRLDDVIQGVEIKEFDIAGNQVHGYSAITRPYTQFLTQQKFDIITNFGMETWPTDLTFSVLEEIKAKKVMVSAGFPHLHDPKYQRYYQDLPHWLKRYHLHIFLSNNSEDIYFARQYQIPNTVIIPNGASEREFETTDSIDFRKQWQIPENHFLILTLSNTIDAKWYEEAIQIFSKADIPNTTLFIVNHAQGKTFKACQKRAKAVNLGLKIRKKRQVIMNAVLNREEVVAALHAADLLLHPSHEDFSPLALFEAAASKTPFLVTDIGQAREIIGWLQTGKLLPTQLKNDVKIPIIPASAKLLEQTIYNPQDLHTQAENGYISWKKRFTWELISKEYETMYKRILEAK